MTHGLILAYREWLMANGFAIATVNRRLATVKVYSQLALTGGEVGYDATRAVQELEQIKSVRGFGHKHGRNRDAKRRESGTPTRVGAKKPYKAVTLNTVQAKSLKAQPATPHSSCGVERTAAGAS